MHHASKTSTDLPAAYVSGLATKFPFTEQVWCACSGLWCQPIQMTSSRASTTWCPYWEAPTPKTWVARTHTCSSGQLLALSMLVVPPELSRQSLQLGSLKVHMQVWPAMHILMMDYICRGCYACCDDLNAIVAYSEFTSRSGSLYMCTSTTFKTLMFCWPAVMT